MRDRYSDLDLALDMGLEGILAVGLWEVEEEVLGGEVGGEEGWEVTDWPEHSSPSTDMLLNFDRLI